MTARRPAVGERSVRLLSVTGRWCDRVGDHPFEQLGAPFALHPIERPRQRRRGRQPGADARDGGLALGRRPGDPLPVVPVGPHAFDQTAPRQLAGQRGHPRGVDAERRGQPALGDGVAQGPEEPGVERGEALGRGGLVEQGGEAGLDVPVVGTGTTRPGGVADTNGFFLQWAGQAVDRGVTGLGGPTVRVESVAARQPDVIVGSAVGADAVTPEIYAQLSAIAPTIVLDHRRLSWQELSAQLGRDLGRVAEATAAEQEYTARASAVGAGLDTSREAVAMTVTDNGFTVFTAESAQGELLAGLGLRLKAVAPSGASGLGGSEVRRDVVPVAGENTGVFGDASLFFVTATDEDVAGYRTAQPVLGSLRAFAENRVHALGPESFRLDRFSAAAVLDRLEQQGS